uniref:Phosphatidylinositol-glycan biosynthesis class W protein n=1 Tax=Panagrolaimus sp. PS1159 TaxID=55785 RepID=A0AC35GUR2_9BILA
MPRLSTGTNQFETLALPAIFAFSILIRNLILKRLNSKKYFTSIYLFFLDYFIFVFPQLLAMTLLADHLIEFIGFLFMLSIFIKYFFPKSKETAQHFPSCDMYTYLRVFVQISTAVAILGVDFRIFPRRFAKTISYGTSPSKKQNYNYSKKSILQFFYSMTALMILGFGKPLLMSIFNYRHELTEYGTHWNFFMTLAVLKIVAFLPSIISILIGIFGSICLASQQDFENYLLSDNRNYDSILDSNREGLISLCGYVLILDISRRFGDDMKNLLNAISSWQSTAYSFALTGLYYSLYYIITVYFDYQPSRRIANLPYILQCLGATHYTTAIVQIPMLFSTISKHSNENLPTLLNYIGSWSLTTFLSANILTGIINVSIQTDQIYSNALQFFILFGRRKEVEGGRRED